MTFEDRLEHLKKGITFEEPSPYVYRKPKSKQAPKMFTLAQKQRFEMRRRGDYTPK